MYSFKGVIRIANKKTNEQSVVNERCNQDSQQEDKRTINLLEICIVFDKNVDIKFSAHDVINIDYYMAFFISYPLSAREPIGSRNDI
jgi:hypothetical protein